MKIKVLLASLLILVALGAAASQIIGRLRVIMTGYEEVPAVSTNGSGNFSVRVFNEQSGLNVTANDGWIDYQLSYQNMEGTVTQAHIHFGQEGVNGGISVWLCANPALLPPTTVIPPGTQPCPPSPGVIRGTIMANNVVGPTAQGIEPGAFNELLRAMQAGKTYANVHSTKFPGGEVRSQIEHDHGGSQNGGGQNGAAPQ